MTITTSTVLSCDHDGCENQITGPTVGAVISQQTSAGWTYHYHLNGQVTHTCPTHTPKPTETRQ